MLLSVWLLVVGTQLPSAISSNYRCLWLIAFQRTQFVALCRCIFVCAMGGENEWKMSDSTEYFTLTRMTRIGKINVSSRRRAYACVRCLRACTYILHASRIQLCHRKQATFPGFPVECQNTLTLIVLTFFQNTHVFNVIMMVAWCLCEINAPALLYSGSYSLRRSLLGPGTKRCTKFKSLSYLQWRTLLKRTNIIKSELWSH